MIVIYALYQMRDKRIIEVFFPKSIVIAPVGNTAPVRFITDCSGQFGEIELSCYFPGGSVEAGLGRLLSDDHCDQGAGLRL